MRFFLEKNSKYSSFISVPVPLSGTVTAFQPKKLRKPRALAQRGFTFIEILIVVSIIIVLSVIVLTNYELGGYQFALQRSAYKLHQDLRKAEEMAMSSKTFGGSVPAGGYGVYLEHNTSTYILFADNNKNGFYNTGEAVEILELEEDTEISQLCLVEDPCACGPNLNIVFIPPDPIIKFNNEIAINCSARITVRSWKASEENNVYLRPTGLIEIEKH